VPGAPQPPVKTSPAGRGAHVQEICGAREGGPSDVDSHRVRGETLGRLTAVLLVGAIGCAALQQGGFFLRGQISVAALLVAALLSAFPVERHPDRLLGLPFAAGALVVGWALVRAVPSGSLRSATGEALLLGSLAVVVTLARRMDARARALAIYGLLGIGVVLAATAWVGVTWRVSPWALKGEGLWRGASTITYANATGCVLAALALASIALLETRRRALALSLVLTLLLLGLATTLSRAAALAFLVGFSVLIVLRGASVLRVLAVPLAGAALAFVSLAPSLPELSRPRPLLALSGLALGLIVVAGVVVDRRRRLAFAASAALVLVAVVGSHVETSAALRDTGSRISASRLRADSPARDRLHATALDVVARHPLVGIGPGRFVRETRSHGRLRVQQYVHDEYAQLLAEQGAIGAALGAVLLFAVARLLWKSWHDRRARALCAGTVAASIAVALQAGFDFVWHVPVVLLCLALLIGLTVKPATSTGEVA
jgi:hypothetical protein